METHYNETSVLLTVTLRGYSEVVKSPIKFPLNKKNLSQESVNKYYQGHHYLLLINKSYDKRQTLVLSKV